MTEQMPIAFMHVLYRYYPKVYESLSIKIGRRPQHDLDCRRMMRLCHFFHPAIHDIVQADVESYSTEDLVGIYRDILI